MIRNRTLEARLERLERRLPSPRQRRRVLFVIVAAQARAPVVGWTDGRFTALRGPQEPLRAARARLEGMSASQTLFAVYGPTVDP